MMDLAHYDPRPGAEEGRWLTLRDPKTDVSLPARIRLRGVDAQVCKDVVLDQRRRRLAEQEKTGKFRVDPAVLDQEEIDGLVAMVVEWDGVQMNGELWPCTQSNVREFFLGWPQFRAQVLEFVASRENFLPPSAPSS